MSAGFADIDNDGDVDLYVTTVRGGNLLLENDGKGRFRDITAAAGLTYVGHSSSAVFFDYNRDGRVDLLLVNVGRYTTETTAAAGDDASYYVAFEDAFAGHLRPRVPNVAFSTATKAATASPMSRSSPGWWTSHGPATPAR